ncbi:hypothetical protein HHK36_033309 [Tetracentron sinense]|uniref:Response regulatory domain-containing protein n=1 Tax=Tetracentron sinense TaxID=13715 RepID=A0A834Y8V9_TETSI|nr:hypothetical protein HHK36_033309 [Tetracentron sinense]
MEGEIVTSVQSSKTKTFPKGVRILVVDDDSTCLAIIASMLRSCKYEVVAVNQSMDALSKLREKEGGFDLILTDVHMPDMDGFELLKYAEEELNLPVIMMSSDDKENIMLRGLESGAAFYLVKPVTLDDLKMLWQYAVVMKKDVTREVEQTGSVGGSSSSGKVYEAEDMECASSVNAGNCRQKKSKRKTTKEMDADEEENKDDSTSDKKARVVWTNELHNQFLKAMDQLGLENAVPKKLLEVMNAPGLTRENIASHLQKYHIFLKRVQEASQSLEPNLARNLASGALTSSFASGHPLLMFNRRQGFPRYPEQQHLTSFQPGLRENFQGLNAPNPMSSFSPTSYLNQEASSSNSISHMRYGQSLLMSNQGNQLQQPLLGTASLLDQEHDPNHIGFGRETHNACLGSSLYGDVSSGLARTTDTAQMIHQTPQARMGFFTNGSLDNNSSTFGLEHGNSNVPSIRDMGSFGNPNQLPNFNNTNINCPGIQMSSITEQVGLGQMGSIGGEETHNYSYNLMDENCNGNMTTEVENSCYATQGVSSGGGFGSTNQFPTMFTSYIQQAAPPPPLPPLQQQQISLGPDGGEDDDLFDLIKSCSTFDNNSLLQPFDESDLGDIIFKQVDESPNQACLMLTSIQV